MRKLKVAYDNMLSFESQRVKEKKERSVTREKAKKLQLHNTAIKF